MQLSSTNFVDGQLSIEVTGNDRVQVAASHGQTIVKFNGQAANLGTVPASQVSAIVVSADLESSGTNRIDLSSVTASRFPNMTGTTISGGAGNDTIWGSAFHDLLDGGTGNDYLLGRNGEDILLGGDGNDRLNGGANSDSLEGGDGRDILIGQAGDDSLFGNADIDRLYGDNGIDWLEGGAGRDTLRGGHGMDSIAGNTPDDIVSDSSWHAAPASPPAIEDSGEDAGDGFAGGSPPTFAASLALPTLIISSVIQNESVPMMTFMLTLTATPTSTVTVNFATGAGSAAAGSDFTSVSGMRIFNAGDIMPKFIDVPIVDDLEVENEETFALVLTGSGFGSILGSGLGTIQDNDIAMSGSGMGNALPVAVDDSGPPAPAPAFTTTEDSVLTIPAAALLANDTDLDGGTLSINSVDGMSTKGASVSFAAGVITYDPTSLMAMQLQALGAGGSTTDTFRYDISDGQGGFSVAMANVSVIVTGVNDPPTAVNDSELAFEDFSSTIDVLDNDTDPDNDPATLTITIVSVTNGTAYVQINGTLADSDPDTIVFTPSLDFYGTATVTYEVSDGFSTSNTATVTISVFGMNDDPTISTIGPQTVNEDNVLGPLSFTVGDVESAATTLGMSVDSTSDSMLFPSGTITFGGTGTNRTVTLTPPANVNGTGTVVLLVTDPDGGTKTTSFQVTINPINDAPVITTNAAVPAIDEGSMVNWQLAVDDPDASEGDTWEVTNVVGLPAGLDCSTAGLVTGRPHYNTSGAHNVTITVKDLAGTGLPATKIFNWTITDRSIATLTGTEANGVTGNLTPNSITVNTTSLSVIYVSPGNKLKLTVAPPSGGTLPVLTDVLYYCEPYGGGASLANGNLASDPVVTVGDDWMVRVGIDKNCDGTLDDIFEVTHGFHVRIVSFAGAKIKAARTLPVDLAEALFEIKDGEIFDTASTFQVQVTGGVLGPASLVRPLLVYGTTDRTGDLATNLGTSTTWTPTGDTNQGILSFYADANNDGTYNPGEAFIDSNTFKVKPLRMLSFTFDLSNQIAAFQAMTYTERQEAVQAAVDAGVKRLRMKDSQADYRAAVSITITALNSPNEIFAQNTARPDAITATDTDANGTPDDVETHFNNITAINHIRFVNSFAGNYGIVNAISGTKAIVEWGAPVPTIVHEIGHLLGLTHAGTTMNIMRDGLTQNAGANKLLQSQADTYSGI